MEAAQGNDHDPFSPRAVRAAYDAVAEDYVTSFGDDLADLPLDRRMLDTALEAAGGGRVIEAGCGPAPAAQHFGDRAPQLVGFDLSAAMLARAGARNPGRAWVQTDLRHIGLRDGCGALVVAYYSLQHVPRHDLVPALGDLRRVLVPEGVLLLSLHLGEGEVVTDEFLGHRIDPVGGALHSRREITQAVTTAGFVIEEARERGPLAHEHQGRRLYVIARRR